MTDIEIVKPAHRVLLDTNILLRLPRLGMPESDQETQEGITLETLLAEIYIPCITFQNLTEFWSAAGRPLEQNGMAMTANKIHQQVEQFPKIFEVLPDRSEAVEIWKSLCIKHQVKGRRGHDVRLVATALSNGVIRVLTTNLKDLDSSKKLPSLHRN